MVKKSSKTKGKNMSEDVTEFRCIVSADLFRRAWFAVSKEETRYYLNGVFIEPCPQGGALITATDGHCLLSFRDPRGVVTGSGIVALNPALRKELTTKQNDLFGLSMKGFPERVVVARGGLLPVAYVVASRMPTTVDGVTTEPRDDLASIFDTADSRVIAAQFRDVIIQGNYPDWRRVVPQKTDPSAKVGAFNAAILTRLSEALSESLRARNVRLIPSAGHDSMAAPHLVLGSAMGFEGFGVLMPLRWDEKSVELPVWAQKVVLNQAA